MNDKAIEMIKELSQKQTGPQEWLADGEDYYDADGASGGNFDDAYENGVRDGRIELAQELVKLLGGINE
jgi:hypothetical protein